MLTQLKIENIAVTEKIMLDVEPGFSVLTGETGAGKSVIVGALGLILGDLFAAGLLRTGAKKAVVSAVFEIDSMTAFKRYLENVSLLPEDDVLMIKRELSDAGKSRSFVNGERVSVSQLKEIGQFLVDICGQHQHQSLISPVKQLERLDAFADNEKLLIKLANDFHTLKTLVKDKEALLGEGNEKDKMLDFYRFNLTELESLDYKEGELNELEADFKRMLSAEDIIETGSRSISRLTDGDASILDVVSQVVRELGSIDDDEKIAAIIEQLEDVSASVNDISETLNDFVSGIDADGENIRLVEERIDRINEVKRKYRFEEADEIISEISKLEDKLSHLLSLDKEVDLLDDKINKLVKSLDTQSADISKRRKKAAASLSKTIDEELKNLGMQSAVFKVDFSEQKISSNGKDKVEFMFSANKGVSPAQLKKCASGGELSRLMLALKAVCAKKDSIPVLIFDEIDSNIGGRLGDVIASKMHKLADSHQVICITHLPQIAGVAGSHFYVSKKETKDSVSVSVDSLEGAEREKEIARMLGGDNYSDTVLSHAKEIIASV